MDEIIWVWPYIVVLAVIFIIIYILNRWFINEVINNVQVGDLFIDPECNRVNSKYLGKWMEYKVIKKTDTNIICEHYWRELEGYRKINEPISTHTSFTYREFYNKFKNYDIFNNY